MRASRSSMPLSAGPPSHAAEVIRRWRRRVGLTQEGLAQALSVTFSTVSRWEYGHDADRAELVRQAGHDDGLYQRSGGRRRLSRVWVARLGCDSELSIPMEWGGCVVGVLTVLWRAGREPSAREAALAEGLAHQA